MLNTDATTVPELVDVPSVGASEPDFDGSAALTSLLGNEVLTVAEPTTPEIVAVNGAVPDGEDGLKVTVEPPVKE